MAEYNRDEWKVKASNTGRYWKAEVRTPSHKGDDGHFTKMGQLIAVCYGPNTVNHAFLIAAAPNMYEALRALITEQSSGVPCMYCGGYIEHGPCCSMNSVFQALEKADEHMEQI